MSQNQSENDTSDFVQIDDADKVPDHEEQQQHPQIGHRQNPLDWTTMDMASTQTCTHGNGLQELKLMMANLEAKNQTLQKILENIELKAENQAYKANAEQKRKMDELQAEFMKMLSTQNVQHQKQMEQLEAKNRKLEEKLTNLELQKKEKTTDKGVKRLNNPPGIEWNQSNTKALILNGLEAINNTKAWVGVMTMKGFPICGEKCRMDNFAGTLIYYYEVTQKSSSNGYSTFGLVGASEDGNSISYSLHYILERGCCDCCSLQNKEHKFEWPEGASKPKWNGQGDVFGCGVVLDSANQMAIFFTLNGILMGKQIPISAHSECLYPNLCTDPGAQLEANFGNDSSKPFKYAIDKCPGMVFN